MIRRPPRSTRTDTLLPYTTPVRSRFEEVRVPHKGNIEHDIIEGVYTVAEDFPRLIDASETMKAVRLSEDERRLLGEVSLVARYGEDESPLRPEQIIEPRRREALEKTAGREEGGRAGET